jgi:peptidyl-dipeptidase Dcp
LKYKIGSLAMVGLMTSVACGNADSADFGPSNPFYAASTLPFGAPPFDKIKDADYQPAIEAGMAQQLAEIGKIATNPAAPTFENTLVAMERSGRLLARASAAFNGVSQANTNPVLQKAKMALAPQMASRPFMPSAPRCSSTRNRCACSNDNTTSLSIRAPTCRIKTRSS